jgi:hypothetical protein
LHSNENLFNFTNNYALVRNHNLLNSKALGPNNNTFLDKKNFNKFLSFNRILNINENKSPFLNFYNLKNFKTHFKSTPFSYLLNPHPTQSIILNQKIFLHYPLLLEKFNDNSDKKGHFYPLRKIFNENFFRGNFANLSILKNKNHIEFIGFGSSS